MSEFDFDFDDSMVDEELYGGDFISLPSITWLGKGDEGFWVVNIDDIDGKPEPYWEQGEHRFGQDPNNPLEDVWKTQRLRCVPIAVRSRQIVEDDAGVLHYYPPMTARSKRVGGTYGYQTQVMILVDGINDPVMLGLGRKYKTVSWSNDGYHRKYGQGVEERLKEYSTRASKQVGKAIPWLCAWEIDLVPCYAEGKPYFVDENGTYVNPFQIDMRTGEPEFPRTRYVGQDTFLVNQALRKEVGVPWENEWKEFSDAPPAPAEEEHHNPNEDDDIPF